MPYEVLARKWRPQVFEDVVGQEHVTRTLVNAIRNDRVTHAYLFGGPRGVGKTSVARILAKALNCEKGEPGVPCNACPSCRQITDGSSVDVQEIDGASNRGIDEIRELRENIRYMPSSSRYRIYIIDEVHMLTSQAFNALLKTLEEPPGHVKFIFATTESHKVPVTILSRCQRFDFKRIPVARITEHLEKIAKKETIEISRTALTLIAKEAEGSMRDAQSLMDQVISFTGLKVRDRDVGDVLGIIDRDIIFQTSNAILEGDARTCLEIVDRIYNHGYDIREFYRTLMEQFRNLAVSLIAPGEHLLDMSAGEREEAVRQAETAGLEKLQALLNFLIRREEELRLTSHPRLILETTLLKLCRLGDFLSFDELIRKIESLEKRLGGPSAPAPGGEAPDRVVDPEAGWPVETAQETVPPGPPPEGEGKTWDDFLSFVSSRNRRMVGILRQWRFIERTEDMLKIARGGKSFSSGYFDDPEHLGSLHKLCREFFERKLQVRIVDAPSPCGEDASRPGAGPPDMETKKRSDIPRPVRDVLRVFQGEIR